MRINKTYNVMNEIVNLQTKWKSSYHHFGAKHKHTYAFIGNTLLLARINQKTKTKKIMSISQLYVIGRRKLNMEQEIKKANNMKSSREQWWNAAARNMLCQLCAVFACFALNTIPDKHDSLFIAVQSSIARCTNKWIFKNSPKAKKSWQKNLYAIQMIFQDFWLCRVLLFLNVCTLCTRVFWNFFFISSLSRSVVPDMCLSIYIRMCMCISRKQQRRKKKFASGWLFDSKLNARRWIQSK